MRIPLRMRLELLPLRRQLHGLRLLLGSIWRAELPSRPGETVAAPPLVLGAEPWRAELLVILQALVLISSTQLRNVPVALRTGLRRFPVGKL